MARGVGALNVSVNADTAKATRNIGTFRSELGRLPGTSKAAGSGLSALSIGIGALAAGGIGLGIAAVRSAAEEIDELSKSARLLGVATEKLAGLRLAAEESGVGVGQLEKSIAKMTVSIDALPANAKNPLAPIGVSLSQLRGLAPEEQLRVIADGMENATSATARLSAAVALFGRRDGLEMVKMLSQGRAGLDEGQAAAERMGKAITAVEAFQIEQANDAIGRIGKTLEGAAGSAALFVAPFAEWVSNGLIGEKGLLTGLGQLLGQSKAMDEHLEANIKWAEKQRELEKKALDRAAAEQKVTEQYEKQLEALKEKIAFAKDPAQAQQDKDSRQFGNERAMQLAHMRQLAEAEELKNEREKAALEEQERRKAEEERKREQLAREAERKHQENLKRDAEELGKLRDRVANFGKTELEIDRNRVLRELDDPRQRREALGHFNTLERLEQEQGRIDSLRKDRETLEGRREPGMLDARSAEGWAALRSSVNPQLQKMDRQIAIAEQTLQAIKTGKTEEVFAF